MPTWLGTWRLRRFLENGTRIPLLDKEVNDGRKYVHSTSCYLYFYVMKKAIFGGKAFLKKLSVTSKLDHLDGLPILFIDGVGGDDPMRFYTDKFKKHIEDRDYCYFGQLDCNHWIMTEEADKLSGILLEWIAAGETKQFAKIAGEKGLLMKK